MIGASHAQMGAGAISRLLGTDLPKVLQEWAIIKRRLVTLDSCAELMKVFGWTLPPILDEEAVSVFRDELDVNGRRRRDAESLLTICRNKGQGTFLEIGTATGVMTASMSRNAPEADIYTVNILPEDLQTGAGGELTTNAFSREEIGSYYRERGCKNIKQIYANTAVWQPDIGPVDIAFVDGCHDTEFIVNDTLKIIPHMRKGGFICWHDCNLDLMLKYKWVEAACAGIARLCVKNCLPGTIFHIKGSWMFLAQF